MYLAYPFSCSSVLFLLFLGSSVFSPPSQAKQDSAPDQKENGLQQTGEPVHEIVGTVDGIHCLVVRCEIFLPDGTAPKEVRVWGFDDQSRPLASEFMRPFGNRIELLVRGEKAQLFIETPDHGYRSIRSFNKAALAGARTAGSVRIELEKTRAIAVKVVDERGQPVEGARVSVGSGIFPATVTDSSGITLCQVIPGEDAHFHAVKGTSQGITFLTRESLDSFSPNQHAALQIFTEALETVRFVDDTGKSIAGFEPVKYTGGRFLMSVPGETDRADSDGFFRKFSTSRIDTLVDNHAEWTLVDVKCGEECDTIVLAPKPAPVRIRGECRPVEKGIPGALVSIGGELFARMDQHGEFVLDVDADFVKRNHEVWIDEPDVASNWYYGSLAAETGKPDTGPVLTIEESSTVLIRVTRGDMHERVADQSINLSYYADRKHGVFAAPAEENGPPFLSRSVDCQTDLNGEAKISIHSGVSPVELVVDGTLRTVPLEFRRGEPPVIEVDLQEVSPAKHRFVVRLNEEALPSKERGDVRMMVFPALEREFEATRIESEGIYQFETESEWMKLVATSADGRLAIAKRFQLSEVPVPDDGGPEAARSLEMKLEKAKRYRGKLLDGNGNVLPGQALTISAFFRVSERHESPGSFSGERIVFSRTVFVDADGSFEVDGIPDGLSIAVYRGSCAYVNCCRVIDYAKLGEEMDTIRIWPPQVETTAIRYRQFAADPTKALDYARSKNQRILLACYKPNRITPGFLDSGLFNPDRVPESANFVPFVLNMSIPFAIRNKQTSQIGLQPDDLPSLDYQDTMIELLILDPDGSTTGRRLFDTTEVEVIDQIRAFLQEQMK